MNDQKFSDLERRVFADFEKNHPKSKQWFDKAAKKAPGGVAGAAGSMRPFPIYYTHGLGNRVWDLDGNELIDGAAGSGVNMLGHCYPPITEAITEAMKIGLHLNNASLGEECNELLCELVPCYEYVRYRNTGTEVCSATTMLARAYTGKDKILKFYGAYHGVDPEFMIGWASRTLDCTGAGIPREALANTVVVMPDVDEVRRKLDEDPNIGGVMTDVIMGVGGILPWDPEELKALRDLCAEREVPLMFDEVLTGWRLALGGAQEFFDVVPDLACHAKATGGGTKFGSFGGRKEIMEALNPTIAKGTIFGGGAKSVFQSGTMNYGTIAIAGAIATLRDLKKRSAQGEYPKLNQRMERYAAGIEKAFRSRGIGIYVHRVGSYYKLHITPKLDTPPLKYDDICKLDQRMRYLFTVALMNEGLFICSPASGSCFIHFAFTDADIDLMLDMYNACLDKYNWAEVYQS